MGSTQKNFTFPCISLPGNNQLLVIVLKLNETHKEKIACLMLLPKKDAQIQDNIIISEAKHIQATLSPTDALAEFNRVFNKETKKRYHDCSLREKMLKALEDSSQTFETHAEIKNYLYYKIGICSVNLLNVQDFATQFIEPTITAMTMQKMQNEFFIRALLHASQDLHGAITQTDNSIYELLGRLEDKNMLKLYWVFTDLKMKYDLENMTRQHVLNLFYTSLSAPGQSQPLKELLSQLWKELNAINKGKMDLSDFDKFQFLVHGFSFSFDLESNIISPELMDRILAKNAYHAEKMLLNDFNHSLMANFYDAIFIAPSEAKKDNEVMKTIERSTENIQLSSQ